MRKANTRLAWMFFWWNFRHINVTPPLILAALFFNISAFGVTIPLVYRNMLGESPKIVVRNCVRPWALPSCCCISLMSSITRRIIKKSMRNWCSCTSPPGAAFMIARSLKGGIYAYITTSITILNHYCSFVRFSNFGTWFEGFNLLHKSAKCEPTSARLKD